MARDDMIPQDVLLMVDVVQEQVERGDALDETCGGMLLWIGPCIRSA
jgi:hypothetical protein